MTRRDDGDRADNPASNAEIGQIAARERHARVHHYAASLAADVPVVDADILVVDSEDDAECGKLEKMKRSSARAVARGNAAIIRFVTTICLLRIFTRMVGGLETEQYE